MTQLVPNPLYAAFENTLRLVEPLVQAVDRDLGRPCDKFHSGEVWTGPTARLFDQQLGQLRSRVRSSNHRIVTDLRQALTRTPREVTEEEAKSIRMRYGLP
jgi:hypothetical protein